MGEIKQIKRVGIDKLIPYINNAKVHSEDQVTRIASSIREFGFLSPVLIDKDFNVIAGHGRIMAARKLGMTEVPCIAVEGLSDAQRKAYILADNRLGELAEWDMDLVTSELDMLLENNFDIDLTGFELPEEEPAAEVVEDDVPEKVETRCKLGDVWQLGDHRLICGDSTSVDVLSELMGPSKADMIFTDPPYNANYKSQGTDEILSKGIKNDNMSDSEFEDFIKSFMDSIALNLKKGGSVYICCNWKDSYPRMYFSCLEHDINVSNCIIWDKKSAGMGWQDYRYQYEFIIYGFNNEEGHKFYGDRTCTDIWECSREVRQNYVHPTQKPVEIPAKAISNSSRKGDVVLDLFCGSGSTLMACEQLGRKCYGCELDEHYCDVIIQRWENLTDKKAVLLNG